MKILLLADIHANYPALASIDSYFSSTRFDHIINCGDSVVFAPFPNEVLQWLKDRNTISILGNTDKKVLKLLRGRTFAKPANPEKRVMYTHTAETLSPASADYLQSLPKSAELSLEDNQGDNSPATTIGIFHGSPARHHEFLFADTLQQRFSELADAFPYRVIVTGHSHTPYHRLAGGTHFINPGSVGRMFDGNPAASCAVLDAYGDRITVTHYRIPYDVGRVIEELRRHSLPPIYQQMYLLGEKLN